MTFPVTPDPSIHIDPTAQQESQAQLEAAVTSLKATFSLIVPQIIQLMVNAVLQAVGLGAIEGTVDHLLTELENALHNFPAGNLTGTLGAGPLQSLIDAVSQGFGGSTGLGFTSLQSFLSGLPNAGAIADAIYQAIAGGLTTGHSAADVKAEIQNIFTNLFGTTTLGTVLQDTAIPDITKAMSSDLQGVIDAIHQAINGGSSTGNTVADVKTQLESVFTNLFGSSNLGTVLAAAAIPNITRSMSTDLQSVIDSVHQAVNGGSSTGNSATDIKTQLQSVFTNLFGTTTLGTVVTDAAIPDITRNMSSDLQEAIDKVHQAINGGSGTNNPVSTVLTNLTNIPQGNVVVTEPSGITTVSHDATSSGSSSNASNSSTTESLTISWTHTIGSTANYVLVPIAWNRQTSGSDQSYTRTVTYGSRAMSSLGYVRPVGTSTAVEIFGLFNPPSGAQTVQVTVAALITGIGIYVYELAGYSSSYIGVASVANVYTTSGSNSSPSQPSLASDTNHRVVQAFGVTNNTTTEVLSSYSQTQRNNIASVYNSGIGRSLALAGGDAAGAATVSFSATASTTGSSENWCGIAVDLKPPASAQIGSGASISRTSTGTITASSGANFFPTNFYNSQDAVTPDITVDMVNAKFTVSNSGWYICDVGIDIDSMSGSTACLAAVLSKNGSVYKIGTDTIRVGGVSGHNPRWTQSTFIVYLSAGDYVQPGYHSFDTGAVMTGEATGTQTYFSITLANRGVIS